MADSRDQWTKRRAFSTQPEYNHEESGTHGSFAAVRYASHPLLVHRFLDSNDLISLPAGIFDGLVALETL